jgi:hypothetical protein
VPVTVLITMPVTVLAAVPVTLTVTIPATSLERTQHLNQNLRPNRRATPVTGDRGAQGSHGLCLTLDVLSLYYHR